MSNTKTNSSNLYFLGPKGEQRKFLSETIELITNDYIFWRRNFYPKDPPAILHQELTSDAAKFYSDKFMQTLIKLLGELKQDLPFFSPRYIAHMTPDITLPGIIGYYAGLLYHSNNVSVEASPVTLKYEVEVGRDFARLFDFNQNTAFGHITSGGTVANYESVYFNKAFRFIPLTVGLIFKIKKLPWPKMLPTSAWELINFPIDDIQNLLSQTNKYNIEETIREYSLASLGDLTFWSLIKKHFDYDHRPPAIIVSSCSHYSWAKVAGLFGIGRKNIFYIKVDENLSMDLDHLNQILEMCHSQKIPILQFVGILGTTEFGTFDPLHKIIPLLEKWRKRKLYCPIHLDAAYGGYFKTIKQKKGNYLDLVFKHTRKVDSITIDPHKLGHVPYGAGVFLTKHGHLKEYLAETAEYCLSTSEPTENLQIGKYILEGSKSGAIAASVYFTNKIITLNQNGYGQLLEQYNLIATSFYEKILAFNKRKKTTHFEIIPIIRPQSNLICFFIKPINMNALNEINSFNEEIIKKFFHAPGDRIHDFKFFASKTKLKVSKLTSNARNIFFKKIKINHDELFLFRLVFLNSWFNSHDENNKVYSDSFLEEIELKVKELIKE